MLQFAGLNVLYVLDSPRLMNCVAQATRSNSHALKDVTGRQWYPDFLVVSLQRDQFRDDAALLSFLVEQCVPVVDDTYPTNPYAAARGVLGGRYR